MAGVLRSLYEATRGRQVATQIGFISMTPPLAPFLKDAPFYVETQADFLLQALTRLCIGAAPLADFRPHAIVREDSKEEFQANRSSRRRAAEPFVASSARM